MARFEILDQPKDWPRIDEFVAARTGSLKKKVDFSAIGIERDGKLIAGIVYSDFNGNNILADIAGEGKRWLTPELLWFMFYYPFEQAGAKRITACVEQTNIVSQQFVTNLGFELEGVMERAGRTGDLLIYRMFKENCRYLETKKHGKKIIAAACA